MLNAMTPEVKGTIHPSQEGQRLDRALEFFFPELGLRARRRLCERSAVLVDGSPARPGFRVRGGQCISFVPTRNRWDESPLEDVRVVARTEHLAALYKPRGLHTARLAGSEAPCVEERLNALLGAGENGWPQLVNRLDNETSGLVAVAMTPEGTEQWLCVENAGLVHKRYLALAHGSVTEGYTETVALDTADRRISRPIQDAPRDPLRATTVTPLGTLEAFTTPRGEVHSGTFTVVGCHIRKGARHQIRAHLGVRNTPLVGDTLYGSTIMPPFYLHHAGFCVGGFMAVSIPDWFDTLPETIRTAAQDWLSLPHHEEQV